MKTKQKTSTYTSTCDALPGDPVPLPPLLLAPVPPATMRVQFGVSPGDPAPLLPPPPASVAPTVPTTYCASRLPFPISSAVASYTNADPTFSSMNI